jgi:hypothetical protein
VAFYTFVDGTLLKLSSVDVVGPIQSESEMNGPIPSYLNSPLYAYRIITLGFAGSAGSLGISPLIRYSTNLEELTAERNALISALQS